MVSAKSPLRRKLGVLCGLLVAAMPCDRTSAWSPLGGVLRGRDSESAGAGLGTCWPGQSRVLGGCLGPPTSCPVGMEPSAFWCVPKMVHVPGMAPSQPRAEGTKRIAPFDLDVTEVTVAEYEECRLSGHCIGPSPLEKWGPGAAQFPVAEVTWYDANDYCRWRGKRLPTADEWDWAAGGTVRRTRYPWGNEALSDSICRSSDRQAAAKGPVGCPVGSHPRDASPEGVLDLAGGVAEWTSTARVGKPGVRLIRGTEFLGAGHDSIPMMVKSVDLGFRCARDPLIPMSAPSKWIEGIAGVYGADHLGKASRPTGAAHNAMLVERYAVDAAFIQLDWEFSPGQTCRTHGIAVPVSDEWVFLDVGAAESGQACIISLRATSGGELVLEERSARSTACEARLCWPGMPLSLKWRLDQRRVANVGALRLSAEWRRAVEVYEGHGRFLRGGVLPNQ